MNVDLKQINVELSFLLDYIFSFNGMLNQWLIIMIDRHYNESFSMSNKRFEDKRNSICIKSIKNSNNKLQFRTIDMAMFALWPKK